MLGKFSLLEKGVILTSLAATAGFTIYQLVIKPPPVKKEEAYSIRKRLLDGGSVRMLYSTMSFMYLQRFKQESVQSLYQLRQILRLGVPNIVALSVSEEEVQEKYQRVLNHPKFSEAISKFQFYLDQKQTDKLSQMSELQLKHVQKLYLMDFCRRKKCKLVYGLRPEKDYEEFGKRRVEGVRSVGQVKAQDMVGKLMTELKDGTTISIIPKNPYKTILCLVDPDVADPTADIWKSRFSSVYGHRIFEEDLLAREKDTAEARTKPHNKPLA